MDKASPRASTSRPAAGEQTGSAPPRASSRRSVALDILRILAALWVVIFHWGGGASGVAHQPDVVKLGYMGVDVFFILSGAVIIHTALGRSWSDFARRRFLRLFPVYLLATMATLVWVLYKGQQPFTPGLVIEPSGLELWLDSTPIVPVAWTLFYEVNFYILVALFILSRRRLDEATALKGVQVFLLASLLSLFLDEPILNLATLRPYGPLFALGAVVGLAASSRDLRRNLPSILLAGFLSYNVLAGRAALGIDDPRSQAIWAGGILLVSGGFLVWDKFVRDTPRLGGRLTAAVTTLSLMTYPVYLIHQQFGVRLINFFVVRDAGYPVAFSVAGAVLLVGTWLVVKFFEPWARALLRRLFVWDAR